MKKKENELKNVLFLLPSFIGDEIENTVKRHGLSSEKISDVRLRADGCSYISVGKSSYPLLFSLDKSILSDIVYKLAEGSIYTHAETIRKGFITSHGFRCGVSGRAVTSEQTVKNVYEYSSVSIRIPHDIENCALPIFDLYKRSGAGILIYSPPAVGKTTLLRDLIRLLSFDGVQFSVIDQRGELTRENTSADCFLYYPKSEGIVFSVRSMSPELIVCDELSGEKDTKAALYAHSCGVPIIATAHAKTFDGFIKRPENKLLTDAGVFSFAVGLSRDGNSDKFSFDVKEL